MPSRWEIEAAVWHSELEPAARLIVLALLRKADNDTAVVPPEHTPSLTTLQAMTGLSRSTLTEWLNALEDAGWVKRIRPPKGTRDERTRYVLLVGAPSAKRRPKSSPTAGPLLRKPQAASSPTTGLVRPPDHPSSTTGPLVVRQPDPSSPAAGPAPLLPLTHLSNTSRRHGDDAQPREDVEQICRHLADRIEGNGSKRPAIGKTWRDAARRLIDIDGRTVDQIVRCIDWCQNDPFWRSNVMSMPTLRAKYDQLRLAAQRGSGRAGHKPYANPADASAYHGEL